MFSSKISILLFLIATVNIAVSLPTFQNYSLNNINDEISEEIDPDLLYLSCKPLCNPAGTKTTVKFYLHTRQNLESESRQELKIEDLESIEKSNFNPKFPTRFIVHGWNQNYNANPNEAIKNAFLKKSDFNIIIVDWGKCANCINYIHARCCVDYVGEQMAQLIDILNNEYDLNFSDLKLIGFSLGAHCAGFAGKNVKNGRINTIIGLDPAKPCFKTDATHERLAATDAEYVEIIHTNGNVLGFYDPIGVASFYPNGGKFQPGCLGPICSHGRSHELYVESITKENKFIPKKCASMEDLRSGTCNIEVHDIRMGGDPSNHGKAEGIYYLPTNKAYPFGAGEF